MNEVKKLVLASGSASRKEILSRLGVPFETAIPDIDETPLENESPIEMVSRLAHQKVKKVKADFTDSIILGGDQVALVEGEVLGKPGCFEKAVSMLKKCSGRSVHFISGICMINSRTGETKEHVAKYIAYFRDLTELEIIHYLEKDKPFECAGALKLESLGIALLSSTECVDPTSITGLPLITVIRFLREFGIEVL